MREFSYSQENFRTSATSATAAFSPHGNGLVIMILSNRKLYTHSTVWT